MNIARVTHRPVGVSELGMIPSWQFSLDPQVNIKINPHVQFPSGVYQTTPQPIGPWMNPSSALNGLGMASSPLGIAWRVLAIVSSGLSAYHGYKRNDSVGWAIGWGLLGGMFPIITPAVAFAQGFGKRKR